MLRAPDRPYVVYNPDSSFYALIDPTKRECEYCYTSCAEALIRALEQRAYGSSAELQEYERWDGQMPEWIRGELEDPAVVIDPSLPDFMRFASEELGYDVTLTKRQAPVR